MKNIPGALSHLLNVTASSLAVEFVLLDLGPGLGALNQNAVMTSEYFIIPTVPDYLSGIALNSLSTILARWHDWSKRMASRLILQETVYPFALTCPKFLGTIVRESHVWDGGPSPARQRRLDSIFAATANTLVPDLQHLGMALRNEKYEAAGMADTYCLGLVPDLHGMIEVAAGQQEPAFALTDSVSGLRGTALADLVESRSPLRDVFSRIAGKIVSLTHD